MLKKAVVGVSKYGRRLAEKVVGFGKGEAPPAGTVRTREIPKQAESVTITRTSKAAPIIAQRLTQKPVLSRFFANNVTPNLAQQLRNTFQLRTQAGSFQVFGNYRGLSKRLSLYAFVTVGMASQSQLVQDSQSNDNIFENIRSIFRAKTEENLKHNPNEKDPSDSPGLLDFHFGPMIAKGCSAAVYEARHRVPDEDIESNTSEAMHEESLVTELSDEDSLPPQEFDTESDIEVLSMEDAESVAPLDFSVELDFESVEESDTDDDIEVLQILNDSDKDQQELDLNAEPNLLQWTPYGTSKHNLHQSSQQEFDLAIKMMFNFDVESVAPRIWQEMENELVPAKMAEVHQHMGTWQNGTRAKMKRLPPHPNIVDMQEAFVSDMPQLQSALDEYPDALPQRINPEGFGRNKTLFIVMKRYPQTLREYLQHTDVTLHQSCLLLAQLLEAVVHMQIHGLAHRDLKSDNILVEVDALGEPHLVVTDFGHCLSSGSFGLRVPYLTVDTCKGGNGALMAPEVLTSEAFNGRLALAFIGKIASATPGVLSWLDYNNSDLWAVGTLAYEIFGAENPFYRQQNGHRLDSASYTEDQLPPLPDYVPQGLQTLISQMLMKDPAKRPNAVQAANMLHMMMWTPDSWRDCIPTDIIIRRWFLTLSAKVICHMAWQRSHTLDIESSLQANFLSRVCASDVDAALDFLMTY